VLPLQTYAKDPGGSFFSGAVGLRVRRAGGIAEAGRITHGAGADQAVVRRAFVSGSRLLTVSDRGIAAAALDTLAPLGFTAFPEQPAADGGLPVPVAVSPAASSARSSSPSGRP
jgi:hypothetical protein